MPQNQTKGRSSSKKPAGYKKSSTGATRKRRPSSKSSASSRKKVEEQVPDYTDEILLIVTLAISILLVLSNFNLAGGLSKVVKPFIFGIMGTLAYIFPFFLFFGVAFYISNRGSKLAKRKLVSSISLYIVVIALLQQIGNNDNVSTKILDFYKESAASKSGGGLIGGLICKLLNKIVGAAGTYVILIAALLVLFVILTGKLLVSNMGKKINESYAHIEERREQYKNESIECDEDGVIIPKRKAKTFTFAKEPKKSNKADIKEITQDSAITNMQDQVGVGNESKEDDVIHSFDNLSINRGMSKAEPDDNEASKEIYEKELQEKFNKNKDYDIAALANRQIEENAIPLKLQEDSSGQMDFVENQEDIVDVNQPKEKIETVTAEPKQQEPIKKGASEKLEIQMEKPVEKKYQFPPVDLLSKSNGNAKGMTDRELKETAAKLQKTLESFGVRVTITNVSCGPAVTRYELQPEQGVKVSRITNLADDIKLNLAAADVRIEAPIPGKAAVGIEVPNKENTAVKLRDLIESDEFKKHPSDIAFAVGKDIGGQTVVTDIGKMPHLLIAGATGSGKSVCINTLIMSILYKANPSDVRLIMVDPKVVELSVYNGIPHLLIPVVTDPKKASAALNWAVMEMTDRYQKFAELGVRDIKGYNEKVAKVAHLEDNQYQKMPQIVIIVDELADLMMVAPGEVEDAICRLAQMARAAGLHLIIATQRPSVNVITGLIKANVPSRIAFSVSSAIDSRTIIDGSGAEKLLGKGDMLFFPSGYPKPVRVQGAFVSDKEVSSVVEFLTAQNANPQYSDEISSKIANGVATETSVASTSDRDDYFIEAGKFIIEKDKASIGMLQRVYKIGFNRAARIMDQLADAGVVGPEEGTKPRKVLMSLEEFEQYIDEYV